MSSRFNTKRDECPIGLHAFPTLHREPRTRLGVFNSGVAHGLKRAKALLGSWGAGMDTAADWEASGEAELVLTALGGDCPGIWER
jgi:hypothetical protein